MRPIPIWYDSYQRTPRAAVDTTAASMQTQDPNAEIFSLFAYKATRYKADATPNSTVVRLNRMTLLISGGLLRRFPARRSLPRRLDAGLYFLKSLFESKPVAAGGAGEDDLDAAVLRGGEPDPHALVREEERHDDPDRHQGAPQPDDVHPRVLRHLEPRVHLGGQPPERKHQGIVALPVEVGAALVEPETGGRLPGLFHDHLEGGAVPLEVLVVVHAAHDPVSVDPDVLVRRKGQRSHRGPVLPGDRHLGRRSPRLPVARLVEPDPLVLERVVHHDRLAEHLPPPLDDAEVRLVRLGLAARVRFEAERVAPDREPEVLRLVPAPHGDLGDRFPFGNVHEPLESEDVSKDRPDEDDDDGEMGHVDAEPGGHTGLRVEVDLVPLIGDHRLREGRRKRRGILRRPVLKGSLLLPSIRERQGLFEVLVQLRPRVPDDLPHLREPVERAAGEIHREQDQEEEEPPGVVHIEQGEPVHEGERPVLVDLVVLLRGLVLLDDRADDRRDGEDDQGDDGELDGYKEIPHPVDRGQSAFLISHAGSPSVIRNVYCIPDQGPTVKREKSPPRTKEGGVPPRPLSAHADLRAASLLWHSAQFLIRSACAL